MVKKVVEPSLLQRLLRPFYNWRGSTSNFGGCGICGDSWSWKEPHRIYGRMATGIFPYCEECHRKATKRQKLVAIDDLYRLWRRQGPVGERERALYEDAIRTVEAEP